MWSGASGVDNDSCIDNWRNCDSARISARISAAEEWSVAHVAFENAGGGADGYALLLVGSEIHFLASRLMSRPCDSRSSLSSLVSILASSSAYLVRISSINLSISARRLAMGSPVVRNMAVVGGVDLLSCWWFWVTMMMMKKEAAFEAWKDPLL